MYDENNIFAKILRKEIPCDKVYEYEFSLFFNDINIEETGYRLITNSGEDGGQEVPHFHIHILAGEKIGSLR